MIRRCRLVCRLGILAFSRPKPRQTPVSGGTIDLLTNPSDELVYCIEPALAFSVWTLNCVSIGIGKMAMVPLNNNNNNYRFNVTYNQLLIHHKKAVGHLSLDSRQSALANAPREAGGCWKKTSREGCPTTNKTENCKRSSRKAGQAKRKWFKSLGASQ